MDRIVVQAKPSGLVEYLLRRFKPRMHHLSVATSRTQLPNGAIQTQFALIPGPGRHIIRYKNAFILANRVRDTKSMNLANGNPWESINLTTLYSQQHVLEDLFREVNELAEKSVEGKTIVYIPRTASWEKFGEPHRKRLLESVILDKGIKEHIVADVKKFLSKEKWYYDRSIPYRRGYLLHGVPGSGKSSFIRALAGHLDYNIAMINLSERGLTDDRLSFLMSILPKRTFVVLEDVDGAFNGRTMSDESGYRLANVTFAGLLNAIDGISSAEERILFLTTNHVDKLDAALIRRGRVDKMVHMGAATRYQAAQLWERFYGDMDKEGVYKTRFLKALEDLGIVQAEGLEQPPEPANMTSTAAFQGLFLDHDDNMEGAIAGVSELKGS
ncbi:MAG: hypothetical protein Q9209_005169 [Squamulea sp. 1 TL-2023]